MQYLDYTPRIANQFALGPTILRQLESIDWLACTIPYRGAVFRRFRTMSQAHLAAVLQHIRRLVIDHTMSNWADGQLLEALPTAQREAAFAVLLLRHGPMVWWLCRRQLRNWHDAEDAFQATFL